MGLLLNDALIALGGNNLSGIMNAVAISYKAAALKDTRFGSTTDINIGGLKNVSISCKGYWDTSYDAALFGGIGGADVLTASASPTEGSIAYFLQTLDSEYQIGTSVGDNMPFSLTADAGGSLIRGILGANKTGITAGAAGTGFNLGAVALGQSLWASLHVVSVAGTTPDLTMEIQGDTTNAFAAPTTVLSFGPASVPGAQFQSVAGALTETWYRANWSITGTSPVFGFILAMGVQ